MKKYLFITFFIVFLASCGKKQEEIPADIIPVDKMIRIMIDIQLMEGVFAHKNLPQDSAQFLYSRYEKDLFKKYQIADTTYQKSFDYYSARPDVMDKLYERIVDSMNVREGQKRLY